MISSISNSALLPLAGRILIMIGCQIADKNLLNPRLGRSIKLSHIKHCRSHNWTVVIEPVRDGLPTFIAVGHEHPLTALP